MPSVSKAQQQAAGIAHAVEKGEKPASELRGASKQMYKGMHGKGELRKFAATKRKGLPRHVERARQVVATLLEDDLRRVCTQCMKEQGRTAPPGCTHGQCKRHFAEYSGWSPERIAAIPEEQFVPDYQQDVANRASARSARAATGF